MSDAAVRRALQAAVFAAALGGGPLLAQDVGRLYSQSELADAGSRYAPNLQAMWDVDFLTRLTPAERQRAGAVTLHLPLVGAQRLPLDFYALAAQRQVFLPIASVKFLDDVFIAMAYYDRRGCSMEAVFDYMGVLRERPAALPGSPRAALGVPANVLDDAVVDDVTQKLLKSAVYFIATHEYAHVMYHHQGYASITAREAQRQETEADAFALEAMRRIAVAPLAMAHFFALASRWEGSPADFDSAGEYETYLQRRASHPVSAQRILAVADALQENANTYARLQPDPPAWERLFLSDAGKLRAIGQMLDDRAMRRALTVRARSLDPATLRTGCRR